MKVRYLDKLISGFRVFSSQHIHVPLKSCPDMEAFVSKSDYICERVNVFKFYAKYAFIMKYFNILDHIRDFKRIFHFHD